LNFNQQIAKYVTGNLTTSQLPEIAIEGLQEGLDSDSLLILAGLSKNDNPFEIQEYFEKSLKELNIKLPEKRQAAIIYAIGLIEEIKKGKLEIIKGVYEIKNNAIDSYDFFYESNKYCYDSIGFEKIYGLFDDYFEVKECGHQWNEKKKGKMTEEIKSELFSELLSWKEKTEKAV
jgi:hypothetical protein